MSMTTIDSHFEGFGLANPGLPPGHILQLPDEVLVDILLTAAEWLKNIDGADFYALYADRRVMTLVCRRFHRLATPLLYSQLVVVLERIINRENNPADSEVHRTGHIGKALGLLHRTLKSDSSLRSLCRDLVVDMKQAEHRRRPKQGLFRFFDLAKWLCGTESLRIHNGFGNGERGLTYSFLSLAMENLPRLKRLALT
ncbi:hypothetical protein N657DRAFT_442102 [Parathielavia appendiculata]|uniref:F-box domain-containing protein n=1 Tax=Parathielavia appendiculata TaxID=2587402 RepID=A0AAN6TQ18_9PEZI|nr:hypothetical protein N657DRAFT_442102 [Parathielavia appendiculata]